MNTERIKEIQKETAYPESISVQQALLKVWNECEQEKAVKNNAVLPLASQQSKLLKAFIRWNNQYNGIASPVPEGMADRYLESL